MAHPTPEAAFRSYWVNTAMYAAVFFPVAGVLAYLRSVGNPNAAPITALAIGGTVAVFAGLWLLYVIPAGRFHRRVQRSHPRSIVFAVTRTKEFDAAIAELAQGHFEPTYLSVVVADRDGLRVLSSKGGSLIIPWNRIGSIEASSTTDFRIDFPCVALCIQSLDAGVRLPLRAYSNAWVSGLMTSPKTIRSIVAELHPFAATASPGSPPSTEK